MTATERLRAMLDERGVEHFDGTETTLWGYEPTGDSTGAYRFAADETSGGCMQVRMFNISPEQAIEATLGRGECEVEYVSEWMGWHCKACDMLWQGLRDQRPHYCPNCGKAVRE